MRPRGEIRNALRSAAQQFGEAGATWRELGATATTGAGDAYRTVGNMVRAGELVPVQHVRVPGSNRPMMRYALPAARPDNDDDAARLAAVLRGWAEFD